METLFVNTKTAVEAFHFIFSLSCSNEFIDCADKQLSALFLTKTGIKPSKNVSFSIAEHFIGAPIYSNYFDSDESGLVARRKLMIMIFINHNWNPITIKWKSKSGIDYKLHSTDIDKDDIEFWFEGLEPAVYLKQLYPNEKLPFKIKDLSFELVVTRLNLDCSILMELNEDVNKENLIKGIGDFIEDFNLKSEKKNRKDGVIHNSIGIIENENAIRYSLDLGSVGFSFF